MKQFWIAAIAIGLWANAAALWLKSAQAQSESYLQRIDQNIGMLVNGVCINRKLCG
jgi:hypothetical protein